MNKYFLVNNKQEWDWLMQKFEENSEIKWLAGGEPTSFKPLTYVKRIVKLDEDELNLTYAALSDYENSGLVSTDQIIEVDKLMEGENHG